MHARTHTHLTALCSGLPGWAGTRKVKPVWILLKQETVSGSGISWAICKSAPHHSTLAPHHSVFYMSDALPAFLLGYIWNYRYYTRAKAKFAVGPAASRLPSIAPQQRRVNACSAMSVYIVAEHRYANGCKQHIFMTGLLLKIAWFKWSVPLVEDILKCTDDEVLLCREDIDGLLCIPVDLSSSSSYAPTFRPGNSSLPGNSIVTW